MESPAVAVREEAAPPVAAARSRGSVVRIVVAVAAVIGIAAGVQRWMWSRVHVTTDNAEIEGSVVPAVARVSGFVVQIGVRENQPVAAGDLLVQLDDREARAKLAQAVADEAVALASAGQKGRPGQAEAQLAAARAQVAQAQAGATKAASDLERFRTLAERRIVSQQQLDAASAANESATAALLAAQKQVSAAQAGWQGASAKLLAARALREQSELQLSYTRIVAPIAGVVSRKSIEVGQYLQAGQTITSVVPLDDLHVTANIKETEIEHVRAGNPVKIDVDAYPGHPVHGVVESFSPATGAMFSLLPPDNATGNYTHVVQHVPVRVRITDRGAAERPLRPGMSVQVTIATRGN
jgi:membrane fusion protein (multidrug efflux system)